MKLIVTIQPKPVEGKTLRLSRASTIVLLLSMVCLPFSLHADSDSDRHALANTSVAIRAAFAKGDVAEAMRYHHPDGLKAGTLAVSNLGSSEQQTTTLNLKPWEARVYKQ